jgi:hypothetical protein
LAATVAVGGAIIALVASQSAPAKPAARISAASLTFTVKPMSSATPDPAFPKPGDALVATFENLRHGRRIGVDQTSCVVVDGKNALQCSTTVGLPGGSAEVVYADRLDATSILTPIVAGTGRYATTRGYFTLHLTRNGTYTATLHVR